MNLVNQTVSVNSFYFAGGRGRALKSFPRQIELNGSFITFAETGLRYLIRRGEQAVQLFDMSGTDGTTYRLKSDGRQWLLVGTKAAKAGA